jgi:hypothetical protein
VQQEKRGAFAVLFEAHADVADLNRGGQAGTLSLEC